MISWILLSRGKKEDIESFFATLCQYNYATKLESRERKRFLVIEYVVRNFLYVI